MAARASSSSEMPHMKLLVIEDAARMAAVLRRGLEEECFAVDVAADGEEGLHLAGSGDYDLVLLDLHLPRLDGMQVMHRLRKQRSDVPVIMVTARDGVADRVAGLDAGADDYLTKPFAFTELLARIRATMRRPGARSQPLLRCGDLELDPSRGQVTRAGAPVQLSAREFALLRALMARPGEVLTRAQLYAAVWDSDYDGLSNVLDVYIRYLRQKIGEDRIATLRGRGYRLDAP